MFSSIPLSANKTKLQRQLDAELTAWQVRWAESCEECFEPCAPQTPEACVLERPWFSQLQPPVEYCA